MHVNNSVHKLVIPSFLPVVCDASSRLMWTCLSCFGHNLHLVVVNSTKEDPRVHRALGLCRKIVTSFSHSWKKKCDLAKAQSDLDLTLVTDCATRWGSRQKMVSRLLEQESSIRQVLSADRKATHLIPTWQDLEVLESIQAALSPFYRSSRCYGERPTALLEKE